MTTNKNILISGAGISGLTLAYWLHKYGFSPTVIEKRPNLDHRGYMIDFYGSGYDVAEKMELTDLLHEKSKQYPVSKLEFVDRRGKTKAKLDVDEFRKLLDHRYMPIMRGDLETVIHEAVRGKAEIQFDSSISWLEVREDAVEVEFSNGKIAAYDLVIGADGIHSNVRRLLWGNESQFLRFLGFYVACSIIENFFNGRDDAFYGHFEPGTQATVYSLGDSQLATFFAFKSEKLNIHGRDQQMDALASALGAPGWVVPQLLEGTRHADDFFFDACAQIELEEWHQGRAALVGDACQCLTLLAGQGASMGMAGAYLLAEELHNADGDHQTAFPAYQSKLKPEIERRQKDARGLAGSFVPGNNFEIALSHFFLNAAFLPGFRSLFKKQIGAKSIFK